MNNNFNRKIKSINNIVDKLVKSISKYVEYYKNKFKELIVYLKNNNDPLDLTILKSCEDIQNEIIFSFDNILSDVNQLKNSFNINSVDYYKEDVNRFIKNLKASFEIFKSKCLLINKLKLLLNRRNLKYINNNDLKIPDNIADSKYICYKVGKQINSDFRKIKNIF